MVHSFDPHSVFLSTTKEAGKFPGEKEKSLAFEMKNTTLPVEKQCAAKQELVVGNLRRVLSFAGKYSTNPSDKEDLTQELFIGLSEKADEYEPDHESGAAFGTFAQWKLYSMANNYRRKDMNQRRKLGQQSDMPDDKLPKSYVSNAPRKNEAYDEYTGEDMQLMRAAIHTLKRVNPEWHSILSQYIGINEKSITAEEIGKLMGVSKQMVLQKIQSALRYLTAILELDQKTDVLDFHIELAAMRKTHPERADIIHELFINTNSTFTLESLAKKEGRELSGALRRIQSALKDMVVRMDVHNPFKIEETFDLTLFKHRPKEATPPSEESHSS